MTALLGSERLLGIMSMPKAASKLRLDFSNLLGPLVRVLLTGGAVLLRSLVLVGRRPLRPKRCRSIAFSLAPGSCA